MQAPTQIIHLNVGGCYFSTTRTTLTGSDTFFSRLVETAPQHSDFFIDRDPTYFRLILNWLRGSRVVPRDSDAAQELRVEADFYCMRDLCDALDKSANRRYSLLQELHSLNENIRLH